MKQVTLTFPHIPPRTFTVNTQPGPAFVRLVEEHRDTLLQSVDACGVKLETDDEYGVRLFRFFTDDADRFNGLVRMSLIGDHTGIDYHTTGDVVTLLEVLLSYFGEVLPKAQKLVAQMDERKQRIDEDREKVREAARAEAEERMKALAEGTPMATCGLCGRPVVEWMRSPTGVAVGVDCACAGKMGLRPAVDIAMPATPGEPE